MLREAYECELHAKHLTDVVQTNPMPTWGYVEWLEDRIQQAMKSAPSTSADSDYAAAIRCVKEYCKSRPDSTMVGMFRVWCEDKIKWCIHGHCTQWTEKSQSQSQ